MCDALLNDRSLDQVFCLSVEAGRNVYVALEESLSIVDRFVPQCIHLWIRRRPPFGVRFDLFGTSSNISEALKMSLNRP
jgi:hypothetical protein